jgi:hypothetical protein
MFRSGQLKLCKDGFIRRTAPSDGVLFETPWHHARHLCNMQCYRDHHIKFKFFGYIPPRCLECWKIVVMPRTLKELMKLKNLQKELDVPGKCGIELRHYTSRTYGGYFYTNSLDEGQRRYKQVREAVSDNIGAFVNVILKRGCTEMEMLGGPSDMWAISDNFIELDEKINNYCEFNHAAVLNRGHGDLAYNRAMQLWIDWAYAIGDETSKEYNGGKPLYPAPVTYHDKDAGALKVQLAANRVMRLHGTPPHVVGEAFEKLGETGLSREALGRLQGFHNISPFNIGDHVEIT